MSKLVPIRSKGELNKYISTNRKNKYLIIFFYLKWCPHCKHVAPKMHQLARNNKLSQIVTVDMETLPTVAQEFDVHSGPTFVVYKGTQHVQTILGDFSALLALLN